MGTTSTGLDSSLHDVGGLDVSVDVEPVVLAGEHDAAILHERHVEALRMLHLALQSSQQLPSLHMTR